MSSKPRRDLRASSAIAKARWQLAVVTLCLIALIAGVIYLRATRTARHDVAAPLTAPAEKAPAPGVGAAANAAASQTPATSTPKRFAEKRPHLKVYELRKRGLARALLRFRPDPG